MSRGNSLGWRLSLVLLVGLSIQTAFGQSGPTLTGTGYAFRSLTLLQAKWLDSNSPV